MIGIQDDHHNLFLEYVIQDYELLKDASTVSQSGLIKLRLKYLESIIKLYKPEYFEPAQNVKS